MQRLITLSILAVSISANVFADSRRADPLTNRAYRAAQRLSQVAPSLSPTQKDNVARALSALENAMQGPGFSYACEEEDPSEMIPAMKQIREVAYSSNGLNMNSSEADAFAQKWARTYPCRSANAYAQNLKGIYEAAYSSNGMNMNSSEAKAITLKWMDTTCELADFAGKIREYYNYAYSSSGMNMGSSDARAYTVNMMERRYFHCASEVYKY